MLSNRSQPYRPSAGRRASTGSLIVTCVPRPGSLCRVIWPPWPSMIFRVVGSPRPEPPRLVEKKVSKTFARVCVVHAAAGVDQVQGHAVGRAVGADDELPALGHRLLGVEHQVQQRPVERLAVQQHRGQIAGEIIDDLDARPAAPWAGRNPTPGGPARSGRSAGGSAGAPWRTGGNCPAGPAAADIPAGPVRSFFIARRSRAASDSRKSSASSSMFMRMVDSGFLISWASPPASRTISVY